MSKPCSWNHEQAWQKKLDREARDAAIGAYARITDKPEKVTAIYDRLLTTEDKLAPNCDYQIGSAKVLDEVLVLHGLSRVLLTAEHATIQMRKGVPKEADMGTGALAEVVYQDTNSTAIIAVGRQTSDANYTANHPVKEAMKDILRLPQNQAHLSLHMLDRGRASHPDDSRGYSIMLGIGNKPSGATLALKDYLVEIGRDYDLRVGVNQPHINFNEHQKLKLNEDGTLRTVTFASAGPHTTRTYSQAVAEELGKDDSFAAAQVEINEVLLVRQNDEVAFPAETDRKLGAYIGYLFVRSAVESVSRL